MYICIYEKQNHRIGDILLINALYFIILLIKITFALNTLCIRILYNFFVSFHQKIFILIELFSNLCINRYIIHRYFYHNFKTVQRISEST